MRGAFGNRVSDYRSRLGYSLRSFASEVGVSPSQMSNIELGREPISERVLDLYVEHLRVDEGEERELRQLAAASAARRLEATLGTEPHVADLIALLRLFGTDLSGEAVGRFKKEIERDLGISANALFLQIGNRQAGRAKREAKAREKMLPVRLASLAWLGMCIRRSRYTDREILIVDVLLDKLAAFDPLFDYQIVTKMPDAQADAFAYLRKEGDGFTLYLRESMFQRSSHDPYYRYVIAHEISHYILHRGLFSEGSSTTALPTARISETSNNSRPRKEIIESLPELDADSLAIFLLIPWERFLTNLSFDELAKDYNVHSEKVDQIGKLFRLKAVYEELARVLYELGEYDHPIFNKVN